MGKFEKVYRIDVLFLQFLIFLNISSFSFGGQSNTSTVDSLGQENVRMYEWEIYLDDSYSSLESHLSGKYQADPKNPKWPYLLSILYVEMRHKLQDPTNYYLSSAATMARQSFELNQNSPFGYFALSNLLNEVNQSEKSLNFLKKMVAITDGDTRWRIDFFEAKVLADLKQFEASFSRIQLLMNSGHRESILLGESLCETVCLKQNVGLASQFLDSWSKKNVSPRIELTRAKLYSSSGHLLQARIILQNAIEIFDHDEAILRALASNLVRETPYKPDMAIQLLDSPSISSLNGQLSKTAESERRLILGRAYLIKGNFKSAESEYLKALTDLDNVEKIYSIVEMYIDQKKLEYASKFLQKAIVENPGIASLHALQGDLLSDDLGQQQVAEDAYLDAITLSPNESEYFSSLGLLYYRMKRFNSALSSFSVATRINPFDAESFYNLACLQALIGERESAMIALERALILSPSLQSTALSDQDLVTLHSLPKFDSLTSRSLSH
jgi:tetratricopeptide (TPR) repeat protein